MEAGVSSVEELKLAIETLTATVQTLQRKVGCEEGVELLKSVCLSVKLSYALLFLTVFRVLLNWYCVHHHNSNSCYTIAVYKPLAVAWLSNRTTDCEVIISWYSPAKIQKSFPRYVL